MWPVTTLRCCQWSPVERQWNRQCNSPTCCVVIYAAIFNCVDYFSHFCVGPLSFHLLSVSFSFSVSYFLAAIFLVLLVFCMAQYGRRAVLHLMYWFTYEFVYYSLSNILSTTNFCQNMWWAAGCYPLLHGIASLPLFLLSFFTLLIRGVFVTPTSDHALAVSAAVQRSIQGRVPAAVFQNVIDVN